MPTKKPNFTDEEVKLLKAFKAKKINPNRISEIDKMAENLKDPKNDAIFFFASSVKEGKVEFYKDVSINKASIKEILDVLDFMLNEIQKIKFEILLKAVSK